MEQTKSPRQCHEDAATDPMIGRRFGRLTIVGRAEDRIYPSGKKGAVYTCACDCGNKKDIIAASLCSGRTKSCGCMLRETSRREAIARAAAKRENWKTLIGQKFGKWTVLAIEDETDARGKHYVRARCDCGKISSVSINSLCRNQRSSTKCVDCQKKETQEKLRGTEWSDGTALCNLTQKKRSNNTTGVKGVTFDKKSGKFRAYITCQGKHYSLGRYSSLEDARKTRERAEEELFDPILQAHGRPLTGEVRTAGTDHEPEPGPSGR